MDMMEQLSRIGIVPVIAINDAADAVPLAQALIDGGLPCAEVTFRTAAAADAIKNMTEAFPDMVVGAGTVLTCEQVDRAVAAGAKFIVSPGLNPTTVKHCQEIGIPVCPGTANPSDIEVALSLGLKTVKFFPAEAAGGLKYIKSIAAPYVDMKFMPTGGVNEKNLLDYLAFDKIIACGGSWMVDKEAVATKNFAKITELTRSAVKTMLGFELKHIGVNCADPEEALKVAKKFSALFGWAVKEGNSSTFAGTAVECMKAPYLGKNGHIAVGTTSVVRAKAYLESQGFEFDESTAKYKGEKLNAIMRRRM